jgi:hypothetical protein
MRYLLTAALVSAGLLSACSTTLEPKIADAPQAGFDLVDKSRVETTAYDQDYAQCAEIANQDHVEPARVATNALGAAADKATLGVIGGKPGKDADRYTVLKRCLEGRGYRVLR